MIMHSMYRNSTRDCFFCTWETRPTLKTARRYTAFKHRHKIEAFVTQFAQIKEFSKLLTFLRTTDGCRLRVTASYIQLSTSVLCRCPPRSQSIQHLEDVLGCLPGEIQKLLE